MSCVRGVLPDMGVEFSTVDSAQAAIPYAGMEISSTQRLPTDSIGTFTLRLKNIVCGSRYRVEVATTGALIDALGEGAVAIPTIADKIADATNGVAGQLTGAYVNPTLSDNTDYTVSVFLKAYGWNYAALIAVPKSGVTAGAAVDLSAGTVGEAPNVSQSGVVSCGDGWYRLWFTFNSGTGATTPAVRVHVADTAASIGSGIIHTTSLDNGIGVWGARMDAGASLRNYYEAGNLLADSEDFSAWTLYDAVDGKVVVNQYSPAAYVGTTDLDLTLPYYAAGNANNDLRIKVRKATSGKLYKDFVTSALSQAGLVITYVGQTEDE